MIRERRDMRFVVTITVDKADKKETNAFVSEFIANLEQDVRDCWFPRAPHLMGYDGPLVHSVKARLEP